MRRKATIEARLWAYLRRQNARGSHFRRQAPFRGFMLDFVDHQALLAIELLDGDPGRRAPDTARRHVLANAGYAVLRLWTRDIEENFLSAVVAIERALEGSRD